MKSKEKTKTKSKPKKQELSDDEKQTKKKKKSKTPKESKKKIDPKEQKKQRRKTIAVKIFACLMYLVIIGVLGMCSYYFYKQKQVILPWKKIEDVEEYTYLEITRMSEKFAYYEETNEGFHFIIDENQFPDHVYIISINENQYETYKAIIDYTYERTEKVPDKIKVYGYSTKVDEEIKNSANKNIANFIPAEKKTQKEDENYESYLPTMYLDVTDERKPEFSIPLCVSFLLLITVFILLLLTIFDRSEKEAPVEEEGEEKDAQNI